MAEPVAPLAEDLRDQSMGRDQSGEGGTKAASGETKHRRTRNGCYTCRSRRVKCDEGKPVCHRCRKGARECKFPEPRSETERPRKAEHDAGSMPEKTSLQSAAKDSDPGNDGIGEGLNKTAVASNESLERSLMRSPSSDSTCGDTMRSSSTENTSTLASQTDQKSSAALSLPSEARTKDLDWSYLSHDVQYYLDYHQTEVNYHHYLFKHVANDFIHTNLVEQALAYEPLLYAVVGFSAFQHTVKRGQGQISDFLGYYNRSIALLRKSLANGVSYTDATLLTVLQLATFEEYLGDFVSVLSHQEAAFRMLIQLYDTQSILENELRRKTLDWYLRFDLTGSFMSGNETTAGREWFVAMVDYFTNASLKFPDEVDLKIERVIWENRIQWLDLARIFSQLTRRELNPCQFQIKIDEEMIKISEWRDSLDPVFSDPQFCVPSSVTQLREKNDPLISTQHGQLFHGPLSTFNFILADHVAMCAMVAYKRALMLQEALPDDLSNLALELCRLFETIETASFFPAEAILKAQSFLGVASLLLPRDEQHTLWCRRRLAKIECLGHIYPSTFRRKMAALWAIPSINHWWLPNEECYPVVARNVRSLQDSSWEIGSQRQRNQDQRDMRGIFTQLSLSERQAESG